MRCEGIGGGKPAADNPPFYRHSRRHAVGNAPIAAGAPWGKSHIQTVKMGRMTQEKGKRLNGAAAAILAVSPPRIDANASK